LWAPAERPVAARVAAVEPEPPALIEKLTSVVFAVRVR